MTDIFARRVSSWMVSTSRSMPEKAAVSLHNRRGIVRNYSLAIARRVPKSFPDALTMPNSSNNNNNNNNNNNKIDYHAATREHENYLTCLRKYIPVVCLPPLDDLPDSVFVEDTVVAIGKKAVVTNPGHPSRRPEVDSIRVFLQDQLGMEVTDMRRDQSNSYSTATAICDGGDVLYTGRHLFVGISGGRTNREALEVLQEGLGVEAIPIPFDQHKGALHLKSIATHLDDRSLVVPDTDLGRTIFQAMVDASGGAYSYSDALWLPDYAGLSCNVVSIPQKGGVLAQLVHEDDSQTRHLLEEAASERNLSIDFCRQTEASKCDGALTCCSVLLDL